MRERDRERERYRGRERERERERKRRKWRHLSSAEMGNEFCTFPGLPKICTLVSPLVNGAEFTPLPRTLHSSKQLTFFVRLALFVFACQMAAWQGIEAPKRTIKFPAPPSSSKKWIQLMLKTNGNRKKRLCVRLRSEHKYHLRKSADRNAQIRKPFVPLTDWFVLFDLQIFWGGVYPPSTTSRAISFF